ncbi:cytochrome P450 71A1 [Selaginella moellendorffii]|uniref:Cytochrome P450-dependent monooxygenase n=2 Tax=Selaginella moellendorffii TaxID=88036 RepID=B2XCI4_SELML|nr:cytochrome P450 71A1 [Selaginella moellendorffii]ABV80343.1 cytochrome P450-dependent monooxygenase [Selaginella moellendorffii]|eukprot:XP_002988182.2 cytochrome P450 71A1 [Selaginella moellendorffii]
MNLSSIMGEYTQHDNFTAVASLSLVLAAAIALLAALYSRLRNSKRPPLPPSPPSKLITGHLHLLDQLPNQSLYKLAKIYGPLIQLRLGVVPVVVASTAEMAREFLKVNDSVCASRPRMAAQKIITYNFTDIGWAAYGAHWRQLRKICTLELFTHRRMQETAKVRARELADTMAGIYRDRETSINMNTRIFSLTMNVINQMVMRKKPFSGSDTTEAREFIDLINGVFMVWGAFNIGDYIPGLSIFDFQGYIGMAKVLHKKLDHLLDKVIEEHIQRRMAKSDEPPDFVDVLLALTLEDGSKVSHKTIKGIIVDMIAGGTDTAAVTIEWALSELMRKPHILKKAQEEMDRVVGRDRVVDESDLPNLPYLECIVKEALRLHPSVPILRHESIEDCVVAGYRIPKGTGIMINVWAIGRDSATWENPMEFDPDRFISAGNTLDVRGNHFDLIPFGSGRRMCPGMPLGISMLQMSLGRFIQCFDWGLPPEMKSAEEIDMTETFGLTVPRKYPLHAVPIPRLPAHLYQA